MTEHFRPAWLEIDLNAISHNIQTIQNFVGPQTSIMAIVKANAYGHGLVPSAKAALKAGAAILGVALPQEGMLLRREGIQAEILVLGPCLPQDAESLTQNDLSTVVSHAESLNALSLAAQKHRVHARIHVKIDTGMGRVGCTPDEAALLIAHIDQDPYLTLEGIMSHIAWENDTDHPKICSQIEKFQTFLDQHASHAPKWIHLANSATTQQFPQAHHNLVRTGLLTYGLPPIPTDLPFLPALSLKAQITQLRELPSGQTLSYGGTFTLTKPAHIALIPLGYADGYHRRLSNRAHVLVHGKRCPVVGNVCMDLTLVDVSQVPEAKIGDEITLLGKTETDCITPQDIATWSDTIVHEVISQLSARLPRYYIQ